jgi:hypothetical protein
MDTRFQSQHPVAGVTRFHFEACKERFAHSPLRAASRVIHALDLGIIVIERDATAPDRPAVQPGDKETNVGLE